MVSILLIIHGLVAVVLLGGLTHQTMAACFPARQADGFLASFRAVSGGRYTNVNIVLYLVTATLGGLLYPAYRLFGRTYFEAAQLWEISGSFEIKEQFVAIGLGMLPFYWFAWRQPLDEKLAGARAGVTATLCLIVWYSFLVGHVINNARGLFGR